MTKKSVARAKYQTAMQGIRSLGSLPAQKVEEFRAWSSAQVKDALKAVNGKLKRYGPVNRKALDQFVNFKDQVRRGAGCRCRSPCRPLTPTRSSPPS